MHRDACAIERPSHHETSGLGTRSWHLTSQMKVYNEKENKPYE
jgi:hypothetical protein